MRHRPADRESAGGIGPFGYCPAADPSVIADITRNKSVAIVGNARSLAGTASGEEIEACDIIVRLNAAPGLSPRSHGARTTLLAVSKAVSKARLRQLQPDMLMWMTPRHWYQAVRMHFSGVPICYFPKTWWTGLSGRLNGARPSTGMMTVDMMTSLATFREMKLFGFDFFQSGSLSVRRSSAPIPHDFAKERDMILKLMWDDSRIRLMGHGAGSAPLKEAAL